MDTMRLRLVSCPKCGDKACKAAIAPPQVIIGPHLSDVACAQRYYHITLWQILHTVSSQHSCLYIGQKAKHEI